MPFYYSKVTNAMQEVNNENIHTFIIDKLSHTVLDKFPLAIIEWGESIKRSMDNPSEIMKFILLSAQKRNQISESEACSILHLCPTEPLEYWMNHIQNIDITDVYENWLDGLNNDEESGDEESGDEEYDDDSMPELEDGVYDLTGEQREGAPRVGIVFCNDDEYTPPTLDGDGYEAYDENGTRYNMNVVRQLWAAPLEIY